MCVREHNYWLTTVAMPTPDAAYPLPDSVDVAVIGAGYTGLSAARTLAKSNARVAVLEAETVGWGASSRNGGMVLTGMKLPVEKLVSKYGLEATRRMYAASLASRSEEHTSELQSPCNLVCRLLLEKKNTRRAIHR